MYLLSSLFVRWSSKGGRPFLIYLLDEIVEDVGEGAGGAGGEWQWLDDVMMVYESLTRTKGESVRATSTSCEGFNIPRVRYTSPPRVCLVITPRSGSFQNDRRGGRGRSQRYHIPTKAVTVDVEEVSSGRDGSTAVNIAE